MVAVTVEAIPPGPCPRTGITITDLDIGDSVVSVWRTADEEREPLSGYRRVTMNDAAYVVDWYVPLNRPVTYEVEVISGPNGASRTYADPITVESATGWLMDTLIPQNSIPVVGDRDKNNDIYLRGDALRALEYQADVSIFKIMGSDKPMALIGDRMSEKGLDTSLGTRSAEENARLKKLLRSTANLHFRPGPEWDGLEISGTTFLANPSAVQLPVNVAMGGQITWWDLKSDVVGAPTIKVLTATFTYGDVQILFDTYEQKQDAMAGKTYLDDLKNPFG